MPRIFQEILSIKHFVKDNDIHAIPRPDTPTTQLYNEYYNYCTYHKLEPSTIGVVTRELRRYGYERVSTRVKNRVIKSYRYTGRKPRLCPNCEGLGYIYV